MRYGIQMSQCGRLYALLISLVIIRVQGNGNCSYITDLKWIEPKTTSTKKLIIGEWFTFNCTLNNKHVNATLWQSFFFTHDIQRIADGQRIKVSDNIFLVKDLQWNDTGDYYCKACDVKKSLGFLEIVEGEAFAKPKVTKIPNLKISPYGSTVHLVCEVSGMYDTKWYKVGTDGKLNVEEEHKKHMIKRTFVIPSVTEKDDGVYMCEIKRATVNHKANNTIVVKSQGKAPFFSHFNATSEIILNENSNISVNYSVSGAPFPNITWFRSTSELLPKRIAVCLATSTSCITNRYRDLNVSKEMFSVSKVRYPSDNNITYTCQATNSFGKANKSFTITVHAKPRLKMVKERIHKFQKRMQLNCSVEKANPKMINFSWKYCELPPLKCDPMKYTIWKQIDSEILFNVKVVKLSSYLFLDDLPQQTLVFLCQVRNIIGTDHITYVIFKIKESSTPGSAKNKSVIFVSTVIVVGLFALLTIVLITFALCKRIKIYGGLYIFSYPPIPDYVRKLDFSKDIREQIGKLPYIPEWEFPRERVLLHSELGMGEFGSVWLANATGITEFCPRDILKDKSKRSRLSVWIQMLNNRNYYNDGKIVTEVAVKKLKDDFDKEKLVDLQSELRILIHIGEHENIVNLLGTCTKGRSYDLWVILEYCPNGDLRSFLRRGRNCYEENETSLVADISMKFGPRNLIEIALQIAKGMEFLISRKVVHRDLAARNILLGTGYVAKVADFGLARDVYKYKKYVKKSCTLLPLKWMAIESIEYSMFTEMTDVWSFGVVLWELFTLGQTPYPGISNIDVFKFLLEGKRMEIPTRSTDTISELMKQCWEKEPNDRPSFVIMVKMLGDYVYDEKNFQNGSLPSSETPDKRENIEELIDEDGLQKESYLQVIFDGDERKI